jgi:arylsulfatase A
MLNVSLPEGAGEDSFDQWKFYVNPSQLANGRQTVVNHSLDGVFAIRKGNWKYTSHLGSGGFTAPKTREPEQGEAPGTLYDLNADPGETANMYNEYPEMVKELSIILEKEKAGDM